MIDLHAHTNKSDGSFTPTQLADYATAKGLRVLAVTDHDTVEGVEEALQRSLYLRQLLEEKGAEAVRAELSYPEGYPLSGRSDGYEAPEIVSGIEFSTNWEHGDIHVIGLGVNHRDAAFTARLQHFIDSREGRNREMAQRLADVGIGISYEGMLQMFPDCVLTRAHFAKYLLEYGYVKSSREAFDRYLGPGCPCYVPREKVTPEEAVRMTLEAGGIPILAHPIIYRLSDAHLRELIGRMIRAGLVGIECYYSTHSASEERYVKDLAKEYGLVLSGGSDFHGINKPGLDLGTGYGSLYIHGDVWENLKKLGR